MISVIIPCYNEEKYLPKIIASLKKQTEKGFEIVVVDNNSMDKTFKVAEKLADKVVKCKEQGLSPARNWGAKVSRGEILAFVDADCTVSKDWIKIIKEGFKDKSILGMSGPILHKFRNPLKSAFINFIFYIQFWYGKIGSKLFHSCFLTSPNIAIRKGIFNKLGGFENVVCEDIYLSRKLKKIKDAKIKLDVRMKVYSSTRRLDAKGIIKTLLYWGSAKRKKTSASEYAMNYQEK